MKNHRYTIIILITILSISFQSCDSGSDPAPADEPTLQEQFTEKLSSQSDGWTTANGGSVTIDGINDVSDEWADFKLEFSQFKYKTEGGVEGVWPNSGAWKYNKSDRTDEILRDDGVLIYTTISGSTLTLRFTMSSDYNKSGRIQSLGGDYTFELK